MRGFPTAEVDTENSDSVIRIPSCFSGQYYRYVLPESLKSGPWEAVFPDGIGREWSLEGGILTGEAGSPGEFEISLLLDGNVGLVLKMDVLPEPKSLWKNLPAPEDAPFPALDFQYEQQSLGAFRLMGASLRGRRHAHEGAFREDCFEFADVKDSGFVFALADGAGSAEFARLGANLACKMAVKSLMSSIEDFSHLHRTDAEWRKILIEAVSQARKAVMDSAEDLKIIPQQLATTLSTGFVLRRKGMFVCGAIGVGDCPVVILNEAFHPQILFEPEFGSLGGETYFLTDSKFRPESAQKRIAKIPESDFRFMMAFSDGIYDPLFCGTQALHEPENWRELNQSMPSSGGSGSEDWRSWLEFWSPGEHDDRTILIFCHEP